MAEILLVDDDDDLRMMMELLLADHGHHVRVACHGEEGLVRLREKLPDMVVMDVEMPILSGPGMAERMFIENCGRENIPVMIVSGTEGLVSIATHVGTPYFLAKPFSVDAFIDKIDDALREQRLPRPMP